MQPVIVLSLLLLYKSSVWGMTCHTNDDCYSWLACSNNVCTACKKENTSCDPDAPSGFLTQCCPGMFCKPIPGSLRSNSNWCVSISKEIASLTKTATIDGNIIPYQTRVINISNVDGDVIISGNRLLSASPYQSEQCVKKGRSCQNSNSVCCEKGTTCQLVHGTNSSMCLRKDHKCFTDADCSNGLSCLLRIGKCGLCHSDGKPCTLPHDNLECCSSWCAIESIGGINICANPRKHIVKISNVFKETIYKPEKTTWLGV